ncbi:MAG TPA: NAD-dependent epimerase/dehydratase family protein [Caulobacteraceae bacterium]|nr:NAD-dependent epimerase/dehydratase family protein [Caulobacteraceae bacterium]
MAPVPRRGAVAVTGAAGFLGGWVVRTLLDRGHRVRACVRNPDDEARTGFLRAQPAFVSGRLTLHRADLDEAGSFDAVCAGCHGLAHVAHVSDYNDQDAVARACADLIASVDKSGTIGRVVVTSSIAAVIGEADIHELSRRPVCYEGRYPDEANPKRTVERGQGYSMAKLVAERAFTAAAATSGAWEAVICCPGDIVGPIQSAHQKDGAWQGEIAKMLQGRCDQTGVYRPWMTVDVRDVAAAHVALLESGEVSNGQRFIAWSAETRNVEQVCADIARLLPELDFDAPAIADDFPERIRARAAEFRAIWAGCELRNDRIRAVTGLSFRPLDDSIRDCVESLVAIAHIGPRRRAAP